MKDKKWMRKALSFLLAVFMVTGSMGTVLTAAAEEPETPPTETVEVVPTEAEVIRTIFKLYLDGWGYKKIANYLTDNNVPTPRMSECERRAVWLYSEQTAGL